MKGFSTYKGRWWALLIVSTLIFFILPIFAGAQSESEGTAEEPTQAVEGGTESPSTEGAVEGEVSTGSGEVTGTIMGEMGAPSDQPVSTIEPAKPDDLIPPDNLWIQDRSNDMGGTISLKWPTTESDLIKTKYVPPEIEGVVQEEEKITKYQYYVLHSLYPDAPINEWDIAGQMPADTSYTWEQPGYFGFFLKKNEKDYLANAHYFFFTHMVPNYKPKRSIHKVILSQPEAAVQPPGVEEGTAEPVYKLETFIIDAWLYYDNLKTPEFPVEENKPDEFKVTANLTPLVGEKNAIMELKFVDFSEDGLSMHYRGEYNSSSEPKRGKGLIRLKAVGPNNMVFGGKVQFKKAPLLPVSNINEEERLPDNRYKHYFKIGVDRFDREGLPRWVLDQEPPLGLAARPNLVNTAKWNSLLYAILLTIAILYFIFHARKGKELFIRRIAGLDHVEEAIGRATEMGKPILYVPGMGYMSDVATIAATNILGQVTKKVAEYDSQVLVPCRDPIVMTVCQEVIQEAYIDAGHPDRFNKDNVFFLTDDQFSYVAAVDGIMVRDKPATNFFMGMFYAESLILAETGAGTGAIQIAGTDALAQLPFFITACDYTLIGEELYAASAYLSREPLLLGSLKGQDMAKLVFIILVFVGTILAIAHINFITNLFASPL